MCMCIRECMCEWAIIVIATDAFADVAATAAIAFVVVVFQYWFSKFVAR